MTGQWINENQLQAMREMSSTHCHFAAAHEAISPTMPFCNHCGEPMPLDPGVGRIEP